MLRASGPAAVLVLGVLQEPSFGAVVRNGHLSKVGEGFREHSCNSVVGPYLTCEVAPAVPVVAPMAAPLDCS